VSLLSQLFEVPCRSQALGSSFLLVNLCITLCQE
jgi:hypothetical protein